MQSYKLFFIWFLMVNAILIGSMNLVSAEPGSDIIGTKITLSSSLIVSEKGELQDFIRNQGASSAGPFTIHYYLTTNSDNPHSRILIGTWDVPGLKAGAQKTGNTTIIVPQNTPPGEYYLLRWIDEQELLSGENTSNNLQQSKNPIAVISKTPAGVTGIGTLIPKHTSPGEQIQITIITDHSQNPEIQPTRVFFFLSSDTTPSASMIPLGSVLLPLSEEKGGQEVSETVTIPDTVQAGSYYFFSSFIPGEQMAGTGSASTFWFNEDPIEITPGAPSTIKPVDQNSGIVPPQEPDVVSLETTIPNEAYIGDSFQITDAVRNIGKSEVNIVRIEYLLTPNPDGSKGKHAGWWNLLSLGGDQTRSEQKTLGVPADITPGFYYLTKKITVTSSVAEKNTANNQWVSNQPISIRYNPADPIPDLTHIRTVWPTGQPGNSVQITDTITNIGRSCATDVPVAYYISPYQQFDPQTAIHLGTWKIDKICPLEQKTNSTQITIPSDLTNGEYYFYSVIDPCAFMEDCEGGFPELDKSNNINIGTLLIGPCIFCN